MAAITMAVVATASAVGSAYSQNRAARASARAQRAEQRRADIANARERRATLRNARVAAASIEAQAANTGLATSSAAAGAAANVQSQVASNLNWLDVNQQLSAQVSRANQQAAAWMSRANNWAAVGQIAGDFGQRFGSNPGGGSASKSINRKG